MKALIALMAIAWLATGPAMAQSGPPPDATDGPVLYAIAMKAQELVASPDAKILVYAELGDPQHGKGSAMISVRYQLPGEGKLRNLGGKMDPLAQMILDAYLQWLKSGKLWRGLAITIDHGKVAVKLVDRQDLEPAANSGRREKAVAATFFPGLTIDQ